MSYRALFDCVCPLRESESIFFPFIQANTAVPHCVTNTEWRDGGNTKRKQDAFRVGIKMYVPPIRLRQM